MLGQPKLPFLYLAPTQGAVSSIFFSQFIMASLGKDIFTKFGVYLHDLRLFLFHLPLGPLNRPGLHSLFLWLKGRKCRERTVPTSFSIPLKWRQGWMAQSGSLSSSGLKPLILNLLRLRGGSLCVWWERVPWLELWGAYSCPLAQFQSLSQAKHTPSLSLQQQQRQEQHSPDQREEAGGSTVTDAVQNLHLWVICIGRRQTRNRVKWLTICRLPAKQDLASPCVVKEPWLANPFL